MKDNTKVTFFNNKQVTIQVNKIMDFLGLIKPQLKEDNYNVGVTEIRPIKRDKEDKTYLRSFNTYHLLERDKEELIKFMSKVNGRGFCLYYSVFDFDREMEIPNKKIKNTIHNDNALYTTSLPIDLDNFTETDYKRIKGILMGLGLETVDIRTGHGYQIIFLLDNKVYDKEILKKLTTLVRSKGIDADEAIVDAARIMRLPFTFNCKCLDTKSKYYGKENPIPISMIASTEKRYSVIEIFSKLNTLEDVIPLSDLEKKSLNEISLKSIKVEPLNKTINKNKIKEVKNIEINDLKSMYSMLNFDEILDPIKKMLNGSQEGLRNDVMLFLIPYLRNTLGLNIQTIKEIMVIWGSKCKPSYTKTYVEKEVDRIYAYGLKGPYGKYTTNLAKAYGFLEFNITTKYNKTKIPNEIFEDLYGISDCAFKIYLLMQKERQLLDKKQFVREDIQRIAKIDKSTFYKHINDLLALGYVCKTKTNIRRGESYIYYVNPYFNVTKGFTLIESSLIQLMLNELTDGEMKLYTYLCFQIGSTGGNCWSSQKYIGSKIGKSTSGIANMTKSLHQKNYIIKTTTGTGMIKHTTYTLTY